MASNAVQSAVARLAVSLRPDRGIDPKKVADARNDLIAARTERAIMAALAPEDEGYLPLRQADRDRLAKLLRLGVRMTAADEVSAIDGTGF